MSKPGNAVERRPRADAARNRDLLIATAKALFADNSAEVRLDEVARQAGVGIGTLYRHFPTRDALIEAIYHAEVETLGQAAAKLAATRPAIDALRDWMRLFVDYITTKKIIAPALNAMVGGADAVYARSGDHVRTAMRDLVGRAAAEGHIQSDVDPIDLLRALAGVANLSEGPGWEASAKRLVDILIAGSRPGA